MVNKLDETAKQTEQILTRARSYAKKFSSCSTIQSALIQSYVHTFMSLATSEIQTDELHHAAENIAGAINRK